MTDKNTTKKLDTNRPFFTKSDLILSNFLNTSTYALGTILMYFLNPYYAILYVIFCIIAIILFLKLICTYCPSYGRARCSSGYGRAAAYLFKKGDRRKFSKMFKIYIPFLSIIWFLPLISSLFLLINEFSWALVVIVILFIIISFIVLPYYSRVHSCKKCPNKKECPWRRQ